MLTLSEEAQFQSARRELSGGAVLKLTVTPDERSAELAQFCERIAQLLPQVSVVREDGSEQGPPSIRLPNGVRYLGAPRGTEIPPFIAALSGKIRSLDAPLRARLDAASIHPAEMELYVTPHCTFCPGMVLGLMPLAAANRRIRLAVIDAGRFPEMAASREVRAVPTLVLDGRFRWSGSCAIEELVDILITRDPASMGPASIEALLKEGAAHRLARMMADRNRVFPALIELLSHPQWPVRLGAMVALEELNALAPDLGREMMNAFWSRFDEAPDPVKGDFLYLCAEIGDSADIPRIQTVLRGEPSADVREAAEEALEKLKRPNH